MDSNQKLKIKINREEEPPTNEKKLPSGNKGSFLSEVNNHKFPKRLQKNNIFNGKNILLVNTGSIKKRFIIQRLKKLGLKISVLNKEKNWAQSHVDHWIIADNTNHNEAIQAVQRFLATNPQIKLEGVLTFWEDDVLLTAKIIDKFNLIGIPFDVAQKVRNKFLFRKFCLENSLPVPKFRLIRSQEDLKYAASHFSFPIIIKPAYGSSSAYVVKAENKKELFEAYNYVKTHISPVIESALTDGLEILVEEYLDGDEVDIDMLIQNGKLKFFSISDNYKTNEPFFVETGQSIPSSLPGKNKIELIELAEETLEKLGVQNGCIHFEAKSTKKGPYPIEVNLRMGGDEVCSFVKGAWNVDLIENSAKIALGIYIKIKKPETPRKYITGQYFLSDDSGILVNLDIDEKIKRKKFLEELHFYKEIGDPVLVPPEGYEYLGWVTVSGDNLIDAQDNLEEAVQYVQYEVGKFDAESSVGKTSRKNRFSPAVFNKNLLLRTKIESLKKLSTSTQKEIHLGIIGNLYPDNNQGVIERELNKTAKDIEKTLRERNYNVTFFNLNEFPIIFEKIKRTAVGLMLNIGERINNSEFYKPHIASLLDLFQIPYTGSNPTTLSLALDKIRFKKLLTFHNLPTPNWDYLYDQNDKLKEDLQYPLIVKPSNSDNGLGTGESVVTNKKELKKQIEKILLGMRQPVLTEEYIDGDEYQVFILGNDKDDLQVLPLSRTLFKKLPQDEKIIVQQPPRNIGKKLESVITEIALDTYTIFHCRDYGQVKIRVDKENNPYVIELDPHPSLNNKAGLASVARLAGFDYGALLEEIISIAVRRYKNKPFFVS